MTPEQFMTTLETIRRNFPITQDIPASTDERKRAIYRLVGGLTDDEMRAIQESGLGGFGRLPRHMQHMLIESFKGEARLRSEREPTPTALLSSWDRIMTV